MRRYGFAACKQNYGFAWIERPPIGIPGQLPTPIYSTALQSAASLARHSSADVRMCALLRSFIVQLFGKLCACVLSFTALPWWRSVHAAFTATYCLGLQQV
jgi:hypothetical protein